MEDDEENNGSNNLSSEDQEIGSNNLIEKPDPYFDVLQGFQKPLGFSSTHQIQQSIKFPRSTIAHGISETNSSFRVK